MPGWADQIRDLHGVVHTPGKGEIKRLEPYFVPAHRDWLRNQRPWSEAAIEHCIAWARGEYQRPRAGRISPSAMGQGCERELLFSFAGAPELPAPEDSEDVMESGTFEHLRWQMEGLTHGFLSSAEGWVHDEALCCGGSMDGIGDDGSLFELKNCAPHLFSAVAKGWDWLMTQRAIRERTGKGSAAAYMADLVRKYVTQGATYTLLDSLQPQPRLNGIVSLVFQDRSSKDCYELRYEATAGQQREVKAILEGVHGWIDVDELPDMLEGCRLSVTGGSPTAKQKTLYSRCSYREHCPTAQRVTLG